MVNRKVTPKISPKGYAARTREKIPQKSVLQLAGALAREGCAEILGGKIGEQIRLDSETRTARAVARGLETN